MLGRDPLEIQWAPGDTVGPSAAHSWSFSSTELVLAVPRTYLHQGQDLSAVSAISHIFAFSPYNLMLKSVKSAVSHFLAKIIALKSCL